MARGRRLALLQQATLVWAEDLDRDWYIETGSMGGESKQLPPNPLADKIAQEIERSGKLIVDPELFETWKAELAAGKPPQ
jgi:hypothetical protein